MDAKKYNNIKLLVGIGEGVFSFLLILLFITTGLSITLENYLSAYFTNNYLLFLAFVFVTGLAGIIIFSGVLLEILALASPSGDGIDSALVLSEADRVIITIIRAMTKIVLVATR